MKLLNDIVFKAVFAKEENSELLRLLINALLDYRGDDVITEVLILNPFVEREYSDGKLIILDIKARDTKKRVYNIEVQINPGKNYINRVIFYLSKLFSEQVVIGEDYTNIPKTIGISIIDGNVIFKDNNEIHNTFRFRNIYSNEDLSDKVEIHFIELNKFDKEKGLELGTRFEKWLHLLKFGVYYQESNQDIPEELKTEEGIEMAYQEYRKVTSDDHIREMIWMQQKAKIDRGFELADAKQEGERLGIEKGERLGIEKGERLGIEKGERLGIEKGERLGMEKSIRKLSNKGYSYVQIADMLELDINFVKQMIESK